MLPFSGFFYLPVVFGQQYSWKLALMANWLCIHVAIVIGMKKKKGFRQPTKLDHLCQLWQSCQNVHETPKASDVVENPQMMLVGEKGSHGVNVTGEKASTALP